MFVPDFAHYDKYELAHEGYGRPEYSHACDGPVFGNSQFSIRRYVLGDTRFNEDYVGRGFEDLWMNRELWMRNPNAYRADVAIDPQHAMFHIKNNPRVEGWFDATANVENQRRYERTWRGMKELLPIPERKRVGSGKRQKTRKGVLK